MSAIASTSKSYRLKSYGRAHCSTSPWVEQFGSAAAAGQIWTQRPDRKAGEPGRKVLGHFTGPIAYMIEAAAMVSAVIGHWDDFAIITALLFFNAALEFWQDRKASDALGRLEKRPGAGSNRNARRQVADARSRDTGARRYRQDSPRRYRAGRSSDGTGAITLQSIRLH